MEVRYGNKGTPHPLRKRLILPAIVFAVYSVFGSLASSAQGYEPIRDTIRHAKITAEKLPQREVGARIISLPALNGMVTATGEKNVIKFIQTLPGVSTGAEGSSAMYVRGGNLSGNLITLDGVPIYGSTHLLGMESAFPAEIVSSATFRMGGFHGNENNLTSSHIELTSIGKDLEKTLWSASASNFFLGTTYARPLLDGRLSIVGSLRVSPIAGEFALAKSLLGGPLDSLDHVKAIVYDAFVKASFNANDSNTLALSLFASLDAYGYTYGGDSDEHMSWGNLILNFGHDVKLKRGWTLEEGISFNRFKNGQGIERDMSGTLNNLAIASSVEEVAMRQNFIKSLGNHFELQMGNSARVGWFNPGTSSSLKEKGLVVKAASSAAQRKSKSFTETFHLQLEAKKDNRFDILASSKINANLSDADLDGKRRWNVNPEASLLASLQLTKWLSLEATADWTVQYYHTLEGIPLGWSMDIILPTNEKCPPQRARQYYAGILSSFGNHRLTAGAYQKDLWGLTYFRDAGKIFSSAIAGWRDNLETGIGTSRGVEVLYEKAGDKLNYHLAYTLSKTDRTFERVNEGVTFPAKFDRRHILNFRISYSLLNDSRKEIRLNGFFTYQSGHWETVAAGEYKVMSLFGTREMSLDYFTSTNNYQMPPYSRLDLSVGIKFKGERQSELTAGVYNVLNRHNPFTVTYDDKSMSWRQISLLPIMPNISYHISFQ